LECVRVVDMAKFDSVFMTGTSPVVLPFNCIDDKIFKVTLPLMERLRKLYIIKADESIRLFRTE